MSTPRLFYCCLLLVVSLALTQAGPTKKHEKKPIDPQASTTATNAPPPKPEQQEGSEVSDVKKRAADSAEPCATDEAATDSEKLERSKKQTTTFCVQIEPGPKSNPEYLPVQVNCNPPASVVPTGPQHDVAPQPNYVKCDQELVPVVWQPPQQVFLVHRENCQVQPASNINPGQSAGLGPYLHGGQLPQYSIPSQPIPGAGVSLNPGGAHVTFGGSGSSLQPGKGFNIDLSGHKYPQLGGLDCTCQGQASVSHPAASHQTNFAKDALLNLHRAMETALPNVAEMKLNTPSIQIAKQPQTAISEPCNDNGERFLPVISTTNVHHHTVNQQAMASSIPTYAAAAVSTPQLHVDPYHGVHYHAPAPVVYTVPHAHVPFDVHGGYYRMSGPQLQLSDDCFGQVLPSHGMRFGRDPTEPAETQADKASQGSAHQHQPQPQQHQQPQQQYPVNHQQESAQVVPENHQHTQQQQQHQPVQSGEPKNPVDLMSQMKLVAAQNQHQASPKVTRSARPESKDLKDGMDKHGVGKPPFSPSVYNPKSQAGQGPELEKIAN